MPAPTKPDAVPRSLGAKRSATTVVSAACIELSAITAPTQKRVIAHRLVICGTANRQRPPTSDPVTIHGVRRPQRVRSEEHTSELQSLMRISYAVFCLKKKKQQEQRHAQAITRATKGQK